MAKIRIRYEYRDMTQELLGLIDLVMRTYKYGRLEREVDKTLSVDRQGAINIVNMRSTNYQAVTHICYMLGAEPLEPFSMRRFQSKLISRLHRVDK